ncbi:MAG: S41 family peptidase [Bacteroidota bacterium]|nr:S41 family peptidase [Bacteroidota bacterium]
MNKSGYKRFPTIHDIKVVFVSEDDLWEVPSLGGIARRLTSNSGEVTNPYFSPDGKHIAFSGKEEGEKDVYVIPSEGGANKRLTFIGKNTKVIGWTSDSTNILFSSDACMPFVGRSELFKVSISGGLPEKLPYGVANNIAFGLKGEVLLGRNTLDPARWKRYKGGTAGVFWIDTKGKGKFEKFLEKIKGNFASPIWIGDRIYFISDHEGLGKLYSCNIDGKNIKSHSQNNEYYIRNATSDGKKIVYHAGAEIFVFDPHSNEERKIEIQYYSPQIQRQRKFVDTEKYLEDYNISPDGNSVTLTSRGKSYVFSNWEGPVIQIGKSHGVRYRLTQWLYDKEKIVTVSDDNGSESIEVHTIKDGNKNIKRLNNLDIGLAARLKVSPQENKIAVSNNRYELFLINLDDETLTKIARSNYERIEDFNFSPDGKWIVYSMSDAEYLASLFLYNIETKETHPITPKGFRDYQPTFDPEGRYIYFLSPREFNPVYDTSYFQLGFSLGVRPYLISLKKDIPSPFTLEYGRLFGKKDSEDSIDLSNAALAVNGSNSSKEQGKNSKAKKEKIKVEVDIEGIQNRIVAFPLPEKSYAQITAVKDGLLYSRESIKGSLPHSHWDKYPSDEVLERFDFNTQKSEPITNKITNFKVALNGKTLVYRNKNKLYLSSNLFEERALPPAMKDFDMPSRSKSDWLNLSRVKVNLDPMSEWKQMYSEAWRLQKEHYWTSDMSGIDWDAVYKRYLPLLDKVASRSEFSDLIWEMQGELGTSHAYEMGGDYKPAPNYLLGSLGAEYEFDKELKAYKITHIIKGDPWKNDSPFRSLGVDVVEGDYLIAINGETLNAGVSPNALLVNQANNVVSITIKSASTGKTKVFEVKTIGSDTDARYREWVENRREYVHKKSKGKLGYVHIPDMGPNGFSEFHRYYIYEASKNGLIVDLRDNGGGHVSQLLLEKLSRKHYGYGVSRYGSVDSYPSHSVAGPMVAVTDEYAGSDGDIFSHQFKQMKLGTLVGKRTWGGVIGINPRLTLADGTMTTQPEYATYMKDVGWKVENYGTDPDVEVDVAPQDYAKGKDPQLDKAIEIALEQLKKKPIELPDFKDKPKLSLPVFEMSTNGNGSVLKYEKENS